MATLKNYCPEMNETQPLNVDGTVQASYSGGYIVETSQELKGQGIKFIRTFQEGDFVKRNFYKTGWNEYKFTQKALDKSNLVLSNKILL